MANRLTNTAKTLLHLCNLAFKGLPADVAEPEGPFKNEEEQDAYDLLRTISPLEGGAVITTYSAQPQTYTTTASDFVAKCGIGSTGASVTRTSSVGTSTVSRAAANAKAYASARAAAILGITCPVVVVGPIWGGLPLHIDGFGDSRTANAGFTGAGGELTAWLTTLAGFMNQGAGAGYYKYLNIGQPGQGTDDALIALDAYVLSKRDTATYCAQIMIVWFGVNDKLHHPDWPVSRSLGNIQKVITRLADAGFLVIAATEPVSSAQAAAPAWFDEYSSTIVAKAMSWGAKKVVDLRNRPEIANMSDTSISPDTLHYATAGNNYIAGYMLTPCNEIAASLGMPTSTSSTGGKITPSPPMLTYSGRTVQAEAGNGLPESTLRYTVKAGPIKIGSSVTLDPITDYAVEDVAFYSVATGNYEQSDLAKNTVAFMAKYTAILRNPKFNEDAVDNDLLGWKPGNQIGDGRQKVKVGGGKFQFNGVKYDFIRQRTQNQVIGQKYRITVTVDNQTGGDHILKTVYVNSVNIRWSVPGTYTADYVAAFETEGFELGAEGETISDGGFFDIQPIN
jgi:hypothetical protein